MTKSLIKTDSYKALVSKISRELSELDFFIKRRTAETYWKVGKFIHEHLLENKDRADYGYNFYERLAEDVDRDATTLSRMVQFFRLYPILAVRQELNWNHYKCLITVKDIEERKKLEERIVRNNWGAQELQEYLSSKRLVESLEEDKDRPAVQLPVTRARLYTYKVLEPSYIHPVEEHLVIDLGFKFLIHSEVKVRLTRQKSKIFGEVGETSPKSKNYFSKRDFGGGIRLKEGEIIESIKSGEKYSFEHSDAAPKELYTYKALVEKVVDADTIWLNIDVGFSCWSRQKVRLRGIDAPEIDTQKGQEAKEFVEARLKEVSFVVVKTYKDDKYQRYLVDVFYQKDEENPQNVLEEGIFLNQELLDRKLAKEMEG